MKEVITIKNVCLLFYFKIFQNVMNGKAELSVAIVGTHADLVLKKQLIISVENTYVAYYFVKTLVFFWIV